MPYRVLVATHVRPIPVGLSEPGGVYDTLADALAAIWANEAHWMERIGAWPFHANLRLNEYATRAEAEDADLSDGFVLGRVGGRDRVSGHKPLSTRML